MSIRIMTPDEVKEKLSPPPVPGSKEDKLRKMAEANAQPQPTNTEKSEETSDAPYLDFHKRLAAALSSVDNLIPKPVYDPQLASKFRDIDGLPSNYFYYDWEDKLQIRPFVFSDLIDLAVARSTQDLRVLLAVVARCISKPLEELTIGDFVYVCYWLRLNSYPKSPVVVSWTCSSCEHENVTKLHTSTTQIIEIPEYIELGDDFDIPRMRNYLEYKQAVEDQPLDIVSVLDIAMWVKGDSLKDKLAKLDSSDDLEMFETARANYVAVGGHGVSDRIEATCGEYSPGGCGAVNRVRLEAPLLNFLSGL